MLLLSIDDPCDPMSGRLDLTIDYRDVLSYQLIHQRRLACIGSTDNVDKTRFMLHGK